MEGLIMTAQLMLGLSILVGVHEAGHLFAAKAFGMRVEKFSIGFPPKVWGFQYGETEYSIGAIPLGGFVKISGMIDESLDTQSMSAEPESWEFRAKPAWQRLIVMMGGIIVNVITGVVIFVALTYSNGESYLTKEALNENGIVAYPLGEEIGFRTGDKILKINGRDYEKFSDLIGTDVLLSNNVYYTVKRGEEIIEISIPPSFFDMIADKKKYDGQFIGIIQPFAVGEVLIGSSAEKGGLRKGDKFLSIDSIAVNDFKAFRKILAERSGTDIAALIRRKTGNDEQLTFTVTEEGTLGFRPETLLNYSHRDYTMAESFEKGSITAFKAIWDNMRALGKIFRGEVSASKSVSGPIGIAQIYGGTWEWSRFWSLTGMLSMILAFMNFLPIPALDGGHVAFLTYEIVSGQKPSDKFLENAQKVGMVLLLCIMSFAIFNDIFKAFF